MSHWGARTGYGYETHRLGFLAERAAAEQRHRALALSPRQGEHAASPNDLKPLHGPLPAKLIFPHIPF